MPVPRNAQHVRHHAGGVDDVRIPVQHDPAAEGPGLGMLARGVNQRAQPVRIGNSIVVEGGNQFRPRQSKPDVVGRGEPVIRVQPLLHDLRILAGNPLRRAVRAAVVHHDGLELDPFLSRQRRQATSQVAQPIPGHDHD